MGIFDFLSDTIGIDAGSQHLRIAKHGQIIFNENAELSVDVVNNKVTGIGNSIIDNETSRVLKPVDHVIADFHGFEHLLRGAIIKTSTRKRYIPLTHVMYMSIPITTTEVEKRAYRDSAEHAGAKEVHMIYSSCAAALGMDILFKKKDFLLVYIGASKIELTPFANGIPIGEGINRIGVWKFKRVIKNYLFRKHNIQPTVEELEQVLYDLDDSTIKTITIQHKAFHKSEIIELLTTYFSVIEDEITEVFESISRHQNIGKIMSNGIYFTGGGSAFNWLKNQLTLNGKVAAKTSESPFIDNINGIIKVMEDHERYKDYLMV